MVHPAQLPGPGPPAVVRDHRRHDVQLRHRAALHPDRARSSAWPTGSPRASSSSAPARSTSSSPTTGQPRRQDQGPDQHRQQRRGLRRGAARRHLHRHRGGRAAGSTTPREKSATASSANGNQSDAVDFFSASPRAGFVWKVAPTVQVFGNASHAYEPPAAARADRARPDRRQPRPARRAEVLAVRGGHPRQRGRAARLGRLGLRHRAVGRDPERERPALPGRPVHDPALPQHRPLAPHRRRGGRRPAAGEGHPVADRARPRRRHPAGARRLYVVALRVRERRQLRRQRPARRAAALHPDRAALRSRLRVLDRARLRDRAEGLLREQPERRAQRRLHARQLQGRLRAQADRHRRVLRGPQPDRHQLLGGGGDGRREPALLLPGRRPLVLRRLSWRWR